MCYLVNVKISKTIIYVNTMFELLTHRGEYKFIHSLYWILECKDRRVLDGEHPLVGIFNISC